MKKQPLTTNDFRAMTTKQLFSLLLPNKADKINVYEIGDMSSFDMIEKYGMTTNEANKISAAIQISERLTAYKLAKQVKKITSSADIYKVVKPLYLNAEIEIFSVVYLNRANHVISTEIVSSGGVASTVVDAKIILRGALRRLASSIILVHNHPSGNLLPSRQDELLTDKLKQGAALMDIVLLDHLIIGNNDNYYSFADEHKLLG